MKRSTRAGVSVAVAAAAAVALASTAAWSAWHLYRTVQLAKDSRPFQSTGSAGRPRVLVIGDSTAKGTGASRPEASLAGLLAQSSPGLAIVNRGDDGARFADFVHQLRDDDRFDAILVVGGGNDVFRFTRTAALRQAVTQVAARAAARARVVVFVPPGNVGNAPFFLPPWRWVMSRRALRLHEIVATAARDTGAQYVDLYEERADDPFAQEPDRMNAPDGLHPSDAGYQLWARKLERQSRIVERLASDGQPVPAGPTSSTGERPPAPTSRATGRPTPAAADRPR